MMEFESVVMTFHNQTDESIARNSLNKANKIIEELNRTQNRTEEKLRLAMKLYLDAFWVFEEIRKELSATIHKIGTTLEEEFQCQSFYDEDKKKYYSSCPAMLLHNDIGFSFRGSEKNKCSICGLPIIECDHITGEYYNDIVCKKTDNICNICGEEDCREHVEGERYDHVQAVKIVYDVNLVTFDLIEDPEMKFARINKVYFEKEDIMNELSEEDKKEFIYGKSKLFCHHCTQCKGYVPGRFHHLFNKKNQSE